MLQQGPGKKQKAWPHTVTKNVCVLNTKPQPQNSTTLFRNHPSIANPVSQIPALHTSTITPHHTITPSHTHPPGICRVSFLPRPPHGVPCPRPVPVHLIRTSPRAVSVRPADWTAGLVTAGVLRRSAIVLSRPRWDGRDGLYRREVQRAQDGAQTQIALDRPAR